MNDTKIHESTPFSVYCQARAVVSMGREYPMSMCDNDPRLLFAAMVGVEDAHRFKHKETPYPSETQFLTALNEAFDRRVGLGTDERRVEVALGVDCRDGIALVWDDGGEPEEAPRILDVIIGGHFRPTRATWQKLIDAGLPMCSWQEASESWDLGLK